MPRAEGSCGLRHCMYVNPGSVRGHAEYRPIVESRESLSPGNMKPLTAAETATSGLNSKASHPLCAIGFQGKPNIVRYRLRGLLLCPSQ